LPSAFAAQALPGTLPYEARTFLPCFSHGDLHSSDRPAKFAVNCSYFFAQSTFCISPSSHHAIRHVGDRAEYNQQGKITDTVADHGDRCILYRVQDRSHKSAHPYKWLHWDKQVHRHHS